jgi:cytoskeletal protein RodZ
MSKTSQIVLGIAVVAVVALGGLYYWHTMNLQAQPENPEVTTLPTGSDSSDSAIEQDLASIDAQIKEVEDDTDSADASVSTAVSPQ